MAAKAGYYVKGGAGEGVPSGSRGNSRSGYLVTFPGNAITAPVDFKNEGWYAAGSAWETWITSGDPGTIPPSGHTLTFLQHLILQ